ncbi:MAG: PAS domain-containing protein, partial [Steroidobacteraceae bacterium]|nr:PAS domain-containing protein [Deltaproteobacteria bacterium]
MAARIQDSSRSEIIRIVATYSLVGALWIYLSDTLLGWLLRDPALITRLSMFKGLLFIALTATLLYVLISRYINRIVEQTNESSRVQQELARQKALLDNVIEGTSDAVYVKDPHGRYLLANSAVAGFVGKPVEEIIGRDDTTLFAADDAQAIMAQDRWVMSQAAPQTYEEHVATPHGERYFLATKGAIRSEDGHVTALFGIARDITERKLIEETLLFLLQSGSLESGESFFELL